MRIAFRVFLLAIGLASSLDAVTGRAGELIEFPNLPEQAPASLLGSVLVATKTRRGSPPHGIPIRRR